MIRRFIFRARDFILDQIPPLNFITLHYTYFIATCLVSAVIFWGASTPARSVSFTDSLFLTVSAMTLAGLNTVNLSTLNTFQQVMLFLLIMLGSAIFVSAFVVQVRRAAFEKVFQDVVKKRERPLQRLRRLSSLSSSRTRVVHPPMESSSQEDVPLQDQNDKTAATDGGLGIQETDSGSRDQRETDVAEPLSPAIKFSPDVDHGRHADLRRRHEGAYNRRRILGPIDDELAQVPTHQSIGPMAPPRPVQSGPPVDHPHVSRYFETFGGWISRNSQFHGLTDKEREDLGGYEYRAVSFLSWVVPTYFVLWQLIGCIGCGAWVALNAPSTALSNGINPWWVGAFNAVSAFNNSGMSLLDANMVAFQTSVYMLLTMGLLILAGNTCYPIFLRLIVWCLWRIVRRLGRRSQQWAERASTLRFLLDHPRRCYTNLFPAQHTWWLLSAVITLNGTDWAAFEILNLGNRALFAGQSIGTRVIDGLFQALAVRSGGFYVVTIANLRIAVQVLYVVMMYISVYPVVITMRNSNVYEERSLGIYADDDAYQRQQQQERRRRHHSFVRTLSNHFAPRRSPDSNTQFVRQQLRAQLAHDAWTIVLALFVIMIIESGQFDSNPVVFSVFNFLFEIVSAYGCVGISVGVPYAAYSFCGAWHTLSKLVLCVVMLRGRHRGLPVAIDKAVLLPGERNGQREEADGRIRQARSMSRGRPEEPVA